MSSENRDMVYQSFCERIAKAGTLLFLSYGPEPYPPEQRAQVDHAVHAVFDALYDEVARTKSSRYVQWSEEEKAALPKAMLAMRDCLMSLKHPSCPDMVTALDIATQLQSIAELELNYQPKPNISAVDTTQATTSALLQKLRGGPEDGRQ